MKLVQFYDPGRGMAVGLVQDGVVIDVTGQEEDVQTVNDLLEVATIARMTLPELVERMLDGSPDPAEYAYDALNTLPDSTAAHLLLPLFPPEVWGFGVTYRRSAQIRDEDSGLNIYDRVYSSPRPEVFFKATASRCAGPNAPIGVRSDSTLTATEPELAYVLGGDGEIIGYTLCNDVSAWDIERENPLYLPQSKVFTGCCALGPVLVTADELADPYHVEIICEIIRGGTPIYRASANTSLLTRRLEELTACLCRDNPVPAGTVVSTGTGVMVPNDLALRDGDIVQITAAEIGLLSNPVKQLS